MHVDLTPEREHGPTGVSVDLTLRENTDGPAVGICQSMDGGSDESERLRPRSIDLCAMRVGPRGALESHRQRVQRGGY